MRGCRPGGEFDQHGHDRGQQSVHALRQCLHNEVVRVLVHHERWKKVGLRVHDSESGRVQIQRCAKAQRVLKSRTKQRDVGDDLSACEHAQRNLRTVAEERIADRAAARADDVNDIAAFCLRFHYIRGDTHGCPLRMRCSPRPDTMTVEEIIHSYFPLTFYFALYLHLEYNFFPMSNAAVSPMQRSLAETDPDIADAIRRETRRQAEGLELIASENFVSAAVLEAAGSVMTNSYAEGYPGKSGYGGCEFVDVAESLAISRAKTPSAPNTSTCNPTRARRRTWPSTSRCSSRAKPCSA